MAESGIEENLGQNGLGSNPELQKPQELVLKISGRSIASIEHPQRNEDTLAHSSEGRFALVCDGVGGLGAGGMASRIARDSLAASLESIKDNNPAAVNQQIKQAMIEASSRVQQELPGAGTTATVVKFFESGDKTYAVIGNVGDSRAYLLRRGKLELITSDDSLVPGSFDEKKKTTERLAQVATLGDISRLSEQEKRLLANRNKISQMLGQQKAPTPHIHGFRIEAGDKLILTTDGVHDNLTRAEIEQIVKGGQADLATSLVEKAKTRSAERHVRAKPDDATAAVIEVIGKQGLEAVNPNTKSAEAADTNKDLLAKFEAAIKKPLSPDTPIKVIDIVIALAASPELRYADALAVQRNLKSLSAVVYIEDAFKDIQLRGKFIEARKQIRRMAEVGEALEEFRQFAQTEPDLFTPGSRKAYKFVTGTIPETYKPESQEAVQMITQYNQESRAVYLGELLDKLPNIDGSGGGGGWGEIKSKGPKLSWKENKWPKNSLSLPDAGRIYLNAKPAAIDRIFYELARLMDLQPEIPFTAKTIPHGAMDTDDLNRADKMVLYFDPKDQAAILKTVQELYRRVRPEAFDKNTPKFAAKLTDSSGQVMTGIAFGQEPSGDIGLETAFTFNNLREEVLYSLKGLSNPKETEDKVRQQLLDYKVDPSWPAFNLPPQKGKHLYPVIVANSA